MMIADMNRWQTINEWGIIDKQLTLEIEANAILWFELSLNCSEICQIG
jgi:hypothetical protein